MFLCQECKQVISSMPVKNEKLSKDRHVSVSESRLEWLLHKSPCAVQSLNKDICFGSTMGKLINMYLCA